MHLIPCIKCGQESKYHENGTGRHCFCPHSSPKGVSTPLRLTLTLRKKSLRKMALDAAFRLGSRHISPPPPWRAGRTPAPDLNRGIKIIKRPDDAGGAILGQVPCIFNGDLLCSRFSSATIAPVLGKWPVSCQPRVAVPEDSTGLFELCLQHGAAERRFRVVKPQTAAWKSTLPDAAVRSF